MFGRKKDGASKEGAAKKGESKGFMGAGKGFFDKAWDVAGKYMGEPMNKAAGKMGIEGVWPTTMDRECDKAARILRVFTLDGGVETTESAEKLNVQDVDANRKRQKVIKRIPAKAIREAQGMAIFTVFRSGLGFSAASGSGVVIARKPDGTWGGPSGILIHTIGFGFMIGVDVYDVVLLLRTPLAVQSFTHPKISLGGELALVAGPLGTAVMADASYQQAPAWSYVKSKGFYAGVQLDGSIIVARDDENGRFYGGKYSAKQVLEGGTHIPLDAEGLIETILAASDRDTKTDHIPQGLAPSEATGGTLDYSEMSDKLDIQQPKEGFGAPPQYEDLEEISVKCSDCGSSMSMEELVEHDCSGTMIQTAAAADKRRSVPARPKPLLPKRNSEAIVAKDEQLADETAQAPSTQDDSAETEATQEAKAQKELSDTSVPEQSRETVIEAVEEPVTEPEDVFEEAQETTQDLDELEAIGKLEEIKLDDEAADDKIEMTIADEPLKTIDHASNLETETQHTEGKASAVTP